jgi:hypothetical protein
MLDYRRYKFTGIVDNTRKQRKSKPIITIIAYHENKAQSKKESAWHVKMSIKIDKSYLKTCW